MSPFFIFCLHRLHTVRFVVVSSAWTFSKLVRLSSGLPMWTCTYCGLWCNQVVEVVVAAAMVAAGLDACWPLGSAAFFASSGSSSCATSSFSPMICLCGRRCVCLIIWGVVTVRLSFSCCVFVGSPRVCLLPCCMFLATVVVSLFVLSLLSWSLSVLCSLGWCGCEYAPVRLRLWSGGVSSSSSLLKFTRVPSCVFSIILRPCSRVLCSPPPIARLIRALSDVSRVGGVEGG